MPSAHCSPVSGRTSVMAKPSLLASKPEAWETPWTFLLHSSFGLIYHEDLRWVLSSCQGCQGGKMRGISPCRTHNSTTNQSPAQMSPPLWNLPEQCPPHLTGQPEHCTFMLLSLTPHIQSSSNSSWPSLQNTSRFTSFSRPALPPRWSEPSPSDLDHCNGLHPDPLQVLVQQSGQNHSSKM